MKILTSFALVLGAALLAALPGKAGEPSGGSPVRLPPSSAGPFEPGWFLVRYERPITELDRRLLDELTGPARDDEGRPRPRWSEPGRRLGVWIGRREVLGFLDRAEGVASVVRLAPGAKLSRGLRRLRWRAAPGERALVVHGVPGHAATSLAADLRARGFEPRPLPGAPGTSGTGSGSLVDSSLVDAFLVPAFLVEVGTPAGIEEVASLPGVRRLALLEELRRAPASAPGPGKATWSESASLPDELAEPAAWVLHVPADAGTLRARLAWQDPDPSLRLGEEPGRPVNELELVLRDPAGRTVPLPGEALGGGCFEATLEQEAPQEGRWTLLVRAGPGAYAAAQSFDVSVEGDVDVQAAAPPTLTRDLPVLDGYDSRQRKLLSVLGTTSSLRSSDDDWLGIRRGQWLSLDFEDLLPTNVSLVSVELLVEHWEQVMQGAAVTEVLRVSVGGGSLQAPAIDASTAAPIRVSSAGEGVFVWDVTPHVVDPAAALVVLENVATSSQVGEVFVDEVLLRVTYQESSSPLIVSVPELRGHLGQDYLYDADGRAQAEGSTPISWFAPIAPAGFTIASNGRIDWIPRTDGAHPITLVASNSLGTDEQSFSVLVATPPRITTTPGDLALVHEPWSYAPTSTGTAPLAWSAPTAPAGLSVDASTGLLTWTPAQDGSHAVTLRVENEVGFDEQDFAIQVLEPPLVLSAASTSGVVGRPYAYDADGAAEASGTAPLTWRVVSGPAGFSIDPATGRVSWTPADEGSQAITLEVANEAGADRQSFQVGVLRAPTVTSTPRTSAEPGLPWSYDEDGRAEASGSGPIAWSLVQAPPGMSLDPTSGALAWTPDAEGSFPVVLRATNEVGSDEQSFVVESALVAPTIVSTPRVSAVVGQPYLYDADGTVEATGTPPLTFGRPPLAPAGFRIDAATGRITWTPATAGSFQLGLRVSNGAGYDDQMFTVRVRALPPTITSVPAPRGTVGRPYLYDEDGRAEAGGSRPVSWSVVSGPPGLTIDALTGAVAWTPSARGTFQVTLAATNQVGTDQQSFSILVGEPPRITSEPAGVALVGRPWVYDVRAVGEGPLEYALLVGPRGATLDPSTGRLAWTPELERDRAMTLSVTSPHGSDLQTFTLRVFTPPEITSRGSRSGTAGLPYRYDADRTPSAVGTPPLVWSVPSGPQALACDPATGRLTWTPTVPGVYPVTLRVANPIGFDEATWTVFVVPPTPPTIDSAPSLTAAVGVPYRYDEDDRATAGGTRPLTWSVVEGPPGFSVDPDTGHVAWTPERLGQVDLALRVDNLAGSDVQRWRLLVSQGITDRSVAPTIVSTPATSAYRGQPYLYDADGRARATGTTPIVWSLDQAPPGFSVGASTGALAWTPAATGLFRVVLRAENEAGLDLQDFTIRVVEPATSPLVTSWPRRVGVVGEPYLYDRDSRAEADGGGSYAWSVVSGPAGLAVDAATGAVSWTPTSTGLFPVELAFTNELGTSTQSWSIRVRKLLPATVAPLTAAPIPYIPPERILAGPYRPEQTLNVFLPPGQAPQGGWPLVISTDVGGGAAIQPRPVLADGEALHDFLQAGLAVVDFGVSGVAEVPSLFYPPGDESGAYESFAPEFDMPEKDVVWAIQKIKRQGQYPLDVSRIVGRGSSQGAVLMAWAAMGEERAFASGSTHVRTSSRLAGVLATHPPSSVWAFRQDPAFTSTLISHLERSGKPGQPASYLGQVAEDVQKSWSLMRFCFETQAARDVNAALPVCLIYAEPVTMVGGAPATFDLDVEGYPVLHDLLGVPNVHDSWFGYVLWRRLLDLSPEAAAFHGQHSVFAVSAKSALSAPFAWHTDTYGGSQKSPEALALGLDWVLRTLDVGEGPVVVTGRGGVEVSRVGGEGSQEAPLLGARR